jgi:two-component system nitrate/nitrite response regulator NarL
MIRVLVVSDIRLYREGIADALTRSGRCEVAMTPADDWELAPTDVVLLDLAHPRARELLAAAGDSRVVALGVREVEEEVIGWAEAGVAGYVTREATLDELVAVVESVARGEMECSPRIAALLLQRVASVAGTGRTLADGRLTPRENEIVGLLDQGLSNKQIARRLSIEPATVKNHVHHILDKLGVARRGEVAAQLRRDGARI